MPERAPNQYLTEEGREGFGSRETTTPRDAVRYVHDILRRASDDRLDVYMLSGALPERFCDEYYSSVTHETFADSIRRVLHEGCNVSIFLWDEDQPDLLSPTMERLARKSESLRGNLSILLSGTRVGHDKLVYFIIANSRDRTPPRWICRVECHQGRHIRNVDFSDDKLELPAVVEFGTKGAMDISSPLLDVFRSFEQAVRDARARANYHR